MNNLDIKKRNRQYYQKRKQYYKEYYKKNKEKFKNKNKKDENKENFEVIIQRGSFRPLDKINLNSSE
jgi:hypothetical protein